MSESAGSAIPALAGARVVLTRSTEASAALIQQIADLGGEGLALPVTGIESLVKGQTPDADELLSDLRGYHWLLFTSANAVTHFLDWLLDRGRDARALSSTRIACVGAATARALRARGLIADVVPERGHGKRVAEAIIAATATAGIDGARARALFPRALSGRPEAVETLRAAGFHVDVLPVYHSVVRSSDDPLVAESVARLRARDVQALGFFAPSQIEALFQILGAKAADLVRACPIVGAIGRTTAAALTARGVDVHVVPATPDGASLVQAIARAWQDRAQEAPSQ